MSDPIEYLLKVRDASESFQAFCEFFHPEFKWEPYQLAIMKVLDRLERGQLRHHETRNIVTRSMFNMPPRHAKSFFSSWLFPAYYIGRNPKRNVLSVNYSQGLANEFGGRVKGYIDDPRYAQIFPDLEIRSDTRGKVDWKTTLGGGYYACGIEGSTTGKPANLLIVDDPVKNREEAESPTYRAKVWNFYNSSLENRKEPIDREMPIEIICLTRWHPDDLGGKIEGSEDYSDKLWYHLKLPAIIQPPNERVSSDLLPPSHPDYRVQDEYYDKHGNKKKTWRVVEVEQPGRALWPSRFPMKELSLKRRRNPREFDALYQQSPYVVGGEVIKQAWWQYGQPEGTELATIIGLDTAYKKQSRNDYSAMAILTMYEGGDILVREVIRGRYDYPELKRKILQVANRYRGDGLRGIYIEDKASGMSLIQDLKTIGGMPIIPYKVSKDKETRVATITPMIEGGQVYLPLGSQWVDSFVDEATSFPNGQFDDMVDAFTIALDAISRVGTSASFRPFPNAKRSLNEMMRGLDDRLRRKALGS